MLKQIPDNSYVVMLDDKGKEFTSEGLAAFLEKRLQESRKDIVFVIGEIAVQLRVQFLACRRTVLFKLGFQPILQSDAVFG